MLHPGCKGHAALRVTTENTAQAMESGELPVLATPAVAALVEKTCWQTIAPELELGLTTVGTSLQLAHTAPTPIGMVVREPKKMVPLSASKPSASILRI